MQVRELIRRLEALELQHPGLRVHVFTADGGEGTPQVVVVKKDGAAHRAVVSAEEDE